jgi:iron complex outermembrane recepter protein
MKQRKSRSKYRSAALVCGACALAWLSAALAQVKSFDIPGSDLKSALDKYGAQAGIQLIYRTDEVQRVRTRGVSGDLSPEEALTQLLQETGFIVNRDATGAIIIVRAGESARTERDSDRVELEEIIVTAARRKENLRSVAQSVTALTETSLERVQANDFQDYAKLVPGLHLVNSVPGSTQIILRGLSSLSAASTAAVYVDDTPYGSSSGLVNGTYLTGDLNSFDMQRIEVLRGPQGTLYGASTMGGLLKFVTNAPDPSGFSAKTQLNTEDVDGEMGWSAKGMVNVPLGDRVALRLTGLRNEAAGFIDDPTRNLENINDVTSTALRASLLIQATDTVSIRLTAVAQDNKLDGANDVDLAVDTFDPDGDGPQLPSLFPLMPYQPLRGDLTQSRNVTETTDIEYRVYNGSVNWDLGWANLMSSSSYGTYQQRALLDVTLVGGVLQRNAFDLSKFTQEFQLTSQDSEQLEWIVGLYYTRETGGIAQRYFNYVYDGSALEIDSVFKEIASFATLTYHFTPQFDVAVGARYARNDQDVLQHGIGLFSGFLSRQDSSEDVILYSIAPRWKVNDATTLYARIASGYRPGGPNIIPLGNPNDAPRTYDSDTVISYEAGVKSDLFERRLSLDLSAYLLQWKDLQLTGIVNSTGVVGNAGEAQSKGFEWAATVRPVRGLALALSGAYTDAKLTQDTAPPPPGIDLLDGKDGDPMPYVPEWSTAADVSYEWTLFGDATAYVGATWSYIGERMTDFGSRFGRRLELPSYDTTDLRAGVDFDRWSIELYGKNLGDERGISYFGSSASTGGGGVFTDAGYGFGSTFLLIRPRTVGLMLSARF